jgi:hypothetical protein
MLPEFALTYKQLASAIGTTPRSIQEWRRKFGPLCPPPCGDGVHDCQAWVDFMAAHNLRPYYQPAVNHAEPMQSLGSPEKRRPTLIALVELLDDAVTAGALPEWVLVRKVMPLFELSAEVGRRCQADLDAKEAA